jgi:hypothetical protein
MQRNFRFFPMLAGFLVLTLAAAAARAAGAGIVDNAHIFKSDTINSAQQIIQQIKSQQKHDVRVETYSAIPDDLKSQYDPNNRAQLFNSWVERIGKQNSVSGVVILICMNPGHVQVAVGNETRQHAFTVRDRDELAQQLTAAFKEKSYDAGILDAMRTIQSRMAANVGSAGAAVSPNSGANPGSGYSAPGYSTPSNSGSTTHGFHFGGLLCLGIGALIILMLIVRMFNRNRSSGYGTPPPGGYPPGYVGGGGYPPSGYGGGGGGGFGRGLLGGLLGGALGAWGYDRMTHQGQAGGGYVPPPTSGGGTNDVDTSYSSSGGDFGSSPPDSGGGGDFGSSDSGGGGGDFGGGGDSGGGGGDSGGGGDF